MGPVAESNHALHEREASNVQVAVCREIPGGKTLRRCASCGLLRAACLHVVVGERAERGRH